MPFKHALVSGGAGFIGSHLVKELLKKGLEVTVIDNLSTGKRENIPKEAVFFEGDILDTELVKKIISEMQIDILFHEAARVSIRDSISAFSQDARTNVMGTVSLLSACNESSVRKIVYASSMAVYADSKTPSPISESYPQQPISAYGISKLATEKYCLLLAEAMGMSCTVLRYFNTYGIGQQFSPYVGVITIFINRLLEGVSIKVFGDGHQCRDFIHVSDVVAANILAMEHEYINGVYNIGTGISTSVKELAHAIRKKVNPEAEIFFAPEQPGELKNSIADITSAKKDLGFVPERIFSDSIDEIIEWNRQNQSK